MKVDNNKAQKAKPGTPRYAIHLVVLIVIAATVFFVGLRFLVPEGSKLTGSYDAKSLLYIADAPVEYAGSESCGASNCHSDLYRQWSEGAHGAREEKSKCEVCHGPQGDHPEKVKALPKVRGDGDLVELCLSCHQKMKARSTTGQPQISPLDHPAPGQKAPQCNQCHNPHAPGFKTAAASQNKADSAAMPALESSEPAASVPPLADGCTSCHGPSGKGGFAPALAGQSYDSLKDKLMKFRSGELTGAMMNPIAQPLKDGEIDVLATYFARQ